MKAKSKYNKSLILKHAWMLFRNQNVNTSEQFGKCLKQAWHLAKTNPMALHHISIGNLYEMHHAKILSYMVRKGVDTMIAEELADDVFIKADKYIDKFDSHRSKISTWLITIANSLINDTYRKNKKRNGTISVSDFTDEDGKELYQFVADNDTMKVIENDELGKQRAKIFNRLKPNYQRVANLFFLDGMKYDEIAEICDIPMGSVKGMINRCRTTLQRELQNEKRLMFA